MFNWILIALLTQTLAQAAPPANCVSLAATSVFTPPSAVFSPSTLLKDGSLLVGSVGGVLYKLDQAGNIKKQVQLDSSIYAAPFEMQDGSLALGSEDGNFRILDSATLSSKGSTNSLDGVFSAPVQLKDGTLVYGSYDENAYFVSPDAKGVLRYMTHGPVVASPLILANGDVAIASTDRWIYFTNSIAQKKSAYMTNGKIFSAPVQLKNGEVVVAADDGVVDFITEAGVLKSQFKTGGPILANLTLMNSAHGEVVVVSSEDGFVYFLNSDGKKTASFDTKASDLSQAAVVSDSQVAVSANDGVLYLITTGGELRGSFHLADSPIRGTESTLSSGRNSGPAPADEYFGKARMSVLGIHSAFQDFSLEIAKDHSNASKFWSAILLTEDALEAWENAYPEDDWLPREYFNLARVYEKVLTPEALVRATRHLSYLEAHFPHTWYAKTAHLKLVSEKLDRGFNSTPTVLSPHSIALSGEDGVFYQVKITDQAAACE